MKVLLQRVNRVSVSVDDKIISEIGPGLLLLTGVAVGDDHEKVSSMAAKISNLRIFPDDKGRFHHSLLDVNGSALVIPQFTLFADLSKGGRRPEFFGAARPEQAEPLCVRFCEELQKVGIKSVG